MNEEELKKELEYLKKNKGVSFLATKFTKKIRKPVKVTFPYRKEYLKLRKAELKAQLKGLQQGKEEMRKEIIKIIENSDTK